MKRLAVLLFAAFALVVPAAVLAEGGQYNDPAMSFTPPADYVPLPVPTHDPANFEDPAVVAAFVKNGGKSNASQIILRMQSFEGNVEAFEMTVENDLRNQTSDVFIKKTNTKLSNGMPAAWEEITMGSGFEQIKVYQYVWSDGVRGVTLSITGRYGAVDEPAAKRALANVSAVAYPKYRY
jgi:hypothetical protein